MRKFWTFAPAMLLAGLLLAQNRTSVTEWKPGQFGNKPPKGTTTTGSPKIVDSPHGKAMAFDGKADGIFLPGNPIEGLTEFTIEAVFRPDSDGPPEQRFVHLGNVQGDRALLETRVTKDGRWYLDTYFMGGGDGNFLIDEKLAHAADRWWHAALVVRGGQMFAYVNGVLELQGKAAAKPIAGGASSMGVRQNKQSWFKGAIYSVRITPKALEPSAFTLVKP
jgi:hypothetical protein